MDVILIEFVVKGYHECGFTVMTITKSALIPPIASVNMGSLVKENKKKGLEGEGQIAGTFSIALSSFPTLKIFV